MYLGGHLLGQQTLRTKRMQYLQDHRELLSAHTRGSKDQLWPIWDRNLYLRDLIQGQRLLRGERVSKQGDAFKRRRYGEDNQAYAG